MRSAKQRIFKSREVQGASISLLPWSSTKATVIPPNKERYNKRMCVSQTNSMSHLPNSLSEKRSKKVPYCCIGKISSKVLRLFMKPTIRPSFHRFNKWSLVNFIMAKNQSQKVKVRSGRGSLQNWAQVMNSLCSPASLRKSFSSKST